MVTTQVFSAPYGHDPDVYCLAQNMYFEARNQSEQGQIAVAKVTINRVYSDDFPDDICSVVKQYTIKKGKKICQFSWYCDGKSDDPKEPIFDQIILLAYKIWLAGDFIPDPTRGALFYHADSISGTWFKKSRRLAVKIDNHIFYY